MDDQTKHLHYARVLSHALTVLVDDALHHQEIRRALPDLVAAPLEQFAIAITLAVGPPRFLASDLAAGDEVANVQRTRKHLERALLALDSAYSDAEKGRIPWDEVRARVRSALSALATGSATTLAPDAIVTTGGDA